MWVNLICHDEELVVFTNEKKKKKKLITESLGHSSLTNQDTQPIFRLPLMSDLS